MKNDKIVEISKYLPSGRCIKYTLFESCNEYGAEIFSVSAEFVGYSLELVEDICRDRKSAEKFLYLIASENVEPCHLKDIVYDMLPL